MRMLAVAGEEPGDHTCRALMIVVRTLFEIEVGGEQVIDRGGAPSPNAGQGWTEHMFVRYGSGRTEAPISAQESLQLGGRRGGLRWCY